MKKMILVISILVFSTASAWASGGAVGNGGDILTCVPSSQNGFAGNYTLDFVASYDGTTKLIADEPNPLRTIWTSLYEKGKQSPDFKYLAQSLLSFFHSAQGQLFKSPDYLDTYIWLPQPFGLVDLQDEDLIQIIPENCQIVSNGRLKPNLKQAVIREDKSDTVILRHDPAALRSLSPLQFSHLIVHEWLRSSFKQTRDLREVNKLFHSRQFTVASARDASAMLQNISGSMSIRPRQVPPRAANRIQVPPDLTKIQMMILSATKGQPLMLDISYPQIYWMGCQVRETSEGKPYGASGGCKYATSIEGGQTLWISGRTGEPPSAKIETFALVQVDPVEPDFTLP